ncbi:hypothetical protein QM467_04605 [Rhodoblastus sp. 17X3]|uniref:hypothetical protein n=1 Tax=Rhodoblastus sp. 17X3 TaxID=3047026 RepID=UPI0024B6945C|nr:hypothetical protein [Rhodoblastus sp. 17X3]MDI9847340.1 hypothetical protein [Rhodoblastus sp. 17X3]
MSQLYALDGARSHLTDPREITALMAQDLNDLRRECGSVTQPQLLDRGWTARQVKDHFLHAMEEAFRTYCETSTPPHEAAQAAPLLEFDREMRAQLARIEAPLCERSAHAGASANLCQSGGK